MVGRYYGAFIVDASADLLRRAVVPMGSADVAPAERLLADREMLTNGLLAHS
jgi:hypothetical protein